MELGGGVVWAMRRQSFLKGKVERCQKPVSSQLALCFYQKLLIPRTELVGLMYLLDLLQEAIPTSMEVVL